MIHTILHPTDFTPTSRRAMEYAEFLARSTKSRLIVLHAVAPVQVSKDAPDRELETLEQELLAQGRESVRQLVEGLSERGVSVQGHAVVAPPFDAIESAVREFNADLVVLGTHDVASAAPIVGTLSHQVFFLSKVPTLFIH